jgi:hypothetical protein
MASAAVPTQGNQILVQTPESLAKLASLSPDTSLAAWVVGRVKPWEDHRNRGYQRLWGEYWRLWRGKWGEEDRNRKSERSRLIAPALAQAIESTVSEIEEAVFSKDVWFDLLDSVTAEDQVPALLARDQLLEDLDAVNAKDALMEAILNAAIFGTGIIKISVDVREDSYPKRDEKTMQLKAEGQERVYVCLTSVRPDEFIPDPGGRTIGEMQGCAHRVSRPLSSILEMVADGTYREDAVATLKGHRPTGQNDVDSNDPQSFLTSTDSDTVDVLEYHGKVPANLLSAALPSATKTALDSILEDVGTDSDAESPLVEAIVTIANDNTLLRAMANPFVMTDRSIVAFQFEKVPGRFWGRGVAEKGYNPQKALDAELRARQDALGFISAPMVAVDAGRMPRGFRLEVRPGKVWTTQGPPGEVFQSIKLGDLNAATFNQTQEMERMVQMGTGAFDTATPLRSQSSSGASGASSNSGLLGAFVKRAKRSVNNVDRNLLSPVITKVMWRYMQYDPTRYTTGYQFAVKTAMGIVAREVEAMQLTQLLGMLPEQVPGVSLAVAQGIIENSAVSNKAQITQAINAALKPPSPEQQQKQEELQQMEFEKVRGEAQKVLLENQKTLAEIRKILAEAQVASRRADTEEVKIMQEQERIELQEKELDSFDEQNRIALKRLEIQERQVDAKIAEMRNKPKGETK